VAPRDVTGLIDALQPRHAMFLIKLGTLREVRYAVKIFDFEKIASALGPTGDDLRGHDFCKSAAVERIAKRGEDCGLYAKDVADSFGSKRQWPVLDKRLQANRLHLCRRLEGKTLPGMV